MTFPHAHIQHFHAEGERHGKVDVVLQVQVVGFLSIPAFYNKDGAYHHEEGKGQHFEGRMFVDKVTDAGSKQEHNDHGNYHGDDHDGDLFGQAYCGDDTVEREHRIDDDDLSNYVEHGDSGFVAVDGWSGGFFLAFQFVVDFEGGFDEQEKAAAEHDEIAQAETMAADMEQRVNGLYNVADAKEENNAYSDAGEHPDAAGRRAFFRWQAVHDNGNEDHIVDAQYHFHEHQRQKADDRFSRQKLFHIGCN